jgi:SAM-dependent methyltransferase
MVQGDAAHLPFRDGQSDVVVEANLLHHVSDPIANLREMARVARRHVVLIEPNRWHLPMSVFMAVKRSEWSGLRWDLRFLQRLVADSGLRLIDAAPMGLVYPNQTPRPLIGALARFDKPLPLGAYLVAALEKPRPWSSTA